LTQNVPSLTGHFACYLFFLLDLDFFFGTFSPFPRASESPMAMACLRLVTFLPDLPLFRVPLFFLCIVFSTLLDAPLPYFAMLISFPINHVCADHYSEKESLEKRFLHNI
jgi:hypothetical protein